MGIDRVTAVIEALRKAGMRAQRGFPAEKIPYLTESVAAVNLEQGQVGSNIVAVWIYTPMGLGGAACEEKAMQAAKTVTGMGGKYEFSGCGFDSRVGLFCMKVLAKFG